MGRYQTEGCDDKILSVVINEKIEDKSQPFSFVLFGPKFEVADFIP